MPVQQYIVRKQDRVWEVRLGRDLLSGQPTYDEALNVAQAHAYAAVQRGELSRIMIGTFDGVAIEFPILPPPRRSPAEKLRASGAEAAAGPVRASPFTDAATSNR